MTTAKVQADNRVFISYARADSAIVHMLYAALDARGIGAWVDWEDIPPSAEWMAAIRHGIDASDAFAFVMSPHSLASAVCGEELAHAIGAGKRLIPLVRDEAGVDRATAEVKKLNWIFARTEDEWPEAIERFVEALTTDLVKMRMHARILVRAREWTEREADGSFLLRGRDLREAEGWLASLDAKGPMPSPLHTQFILASQQAERDDNERWKRLYEQSLARQLAAQSQLLVDQRGTALPLATLLAVEAARRSPSLETDQALRKTLSLTPFKHCDYPARAFAKSFWAENADRIALVDGPTVEIRTLDTDRLLATIEAPGPIPERGYHEHPVVLSRDGSRLAAITGDRIVCVWQIGDLAPEAPAVTAERIARFEYEDAPLSLGMTRDAARLAVMTARRTLLHEIDAGTQLAAIEHGQPMVNMALHPDARELAVWGGTAAEIWDLGSPPVNPTRIASIPHNGPATLTMRYSPLGEYLALLQRSTFELNIFHVPTRKLIFAEKRHVDLAFEPRDRGFAIASPEWDIGVYSLPACARLFRMMHDDSVWQVAFSPNGQRLSSVSKDGTVRVWEVEREGREVARVVKAGAAVRRTIFAQDSERLLLLEETSAQLRDARGFRQWRLLDLPSTVFAVDAAPDARRLAFGCRDGSWAVVDYDRQDAVQVLAQSAGRSAMGEQVTDIALAGAKALIKRGFGSYQLIDLESGAFDETFASLQAAVAVACPAGTIVAATEDGEILKWNDAVVARVATGMPVHALACSASGGVIAARLRDGTVTVYDGGLANAIARFSDLFGLGVQIDAAGVHLARWEADDARSRVQVFEIASAAVIADWTVPSRIADLRFDPRGARVVLALHDKSVQVWDVGQSVALASFKHEAGATSACFTADDDVIASGGWDGAVRIWHWRSDALVRAACGRLERNLTEAEWAQYLPGEPYRKTCETKTESAAPEWRR